MGGEAHGQTLEATLNQQFVALQKLKNQIARLEKRNKAQGQQPTRRYHRFGDAPEAVYVEPKPPDPSRINQTPASKTHNHHVINSRFDYNSFADKVKLFKFSGKRGYLRWERNLDEWFYYNNIQKKERLSYAIDHLKDDAFKWWVQEEEDRRFYKEPAIKTWRALKEVMRYEFAPDFTSSEIQELYPRRYPTHGSKEARKAAPQEGPTGLSQQDNFQPNQGHAIVHSLDQKNDIPKAIEMSKSVGPNTLIRIKDKPVQDTMQVKAKVSPTLDNLVYQSPTTCMMHLSLSKSVITGLEESKTNKEETSEVILVMDQNKTQGTMQLISPKEAMSSPYMLSNPTSTGQGKSSYPDNEHTCYRCQEKGHYAVICPTKKVLKETSLETKTDLPIMSDSFILSNLLVQNSCIMHLSLSRGFVTGIKEYKFIVEEPSSVTHVMYQEKAQDAMPSMLLKEAKPVTTIPSQGKYLKPFLVEDLNVFVLGIGRPQENYTPTEVPRAEPEHDLTQNPHHRWKPKSEQKIVQVLKPEVIFTLDHHAIIDSMAGIIYLSCPRGSELGTGDQGDNKPNKEKEFLAATAEIKVLCSLFSSVYEFFYFGIIHLSLPRCYHPGIIPERGHPNRDQILKEEASSMMLVDAVQRLDQRSAEPLPFEFSKGKESFSSFKTSLSLDFQDVMHLSLPRSFDPGIKEVEIHTTQDQKLQERQPSNQSSPKKSNILHHAIAPKVNSAITHSVHTTPVSDIIHLVFVQNVENFSGCKEDSFKEIPPETLLLLGEPAPMMVKKESTKNVEDHKLQKGSTHHVQGKGVIMSHLLKEEPPDAQPITKPKQYQGKTLESQKRMKADLLYLGAGYPVLRSKLCQGGGYDEAIKTSVQPEVQQTVQTNQLGDASNIGPVQGAYLDNQKEFWDESNFHGFYTQEGVQDNWNFTKILSDQDVMDFSNPAFCSASNEPVQPCFGPAMSKNEWASTRGISYVKEGLLGVHIKRNQARDPIQPGAPLGSSNCSKPAKPTSDWGSFQPIQFGSTQTFLW
ncbi:hypothetical protein N665_0466s0008 [Sinapis alba]|nr:hypothetical protein N665_0466s0008 [Sinapis alba]